MRLDLYNPESMSLVQQAVTGVDFGSILQANHSEAVQVVRPVMTTETSITDLSVYLDSKGPFTESSFGQFISGVPILGITPGSQYLSDHFISGVSGSVSMQEGDFLWLDMQAGNNEIGSYPGIKYNFTFDYV